VFAISTGLAIGSGILSVVFGTLWFAMLAGGRRLLARWRFRRRGDRDSEIEWQVFEDRLSVRTVNSHGEFLWSALARILDTPEGFLLYFPGNIYQWIPRHAFDDSASVDAFVERAQSAAPIYIKRA
jgi:hypothetical protein